MKKAEMLAQLDVLIEKGDLQGIKALKEQFAQSAENEPKIDWQAKEKQFCELPITTQENRLQAIANQIDKYFAGAKNLVEQYNKTRQDTLQEIAKSLEIDAKYLRVNGGYMYLVDKGMHVIPGSTKIELVHRAKCENRAPRASGYKALANFESQEKVLVDLWNAYRSWEMENPGKYLDYATIGKIAFAVSEGKIATKDNKARTSFNWKKGDKALQPLEKVFDTGNDDDDDDEKTG